MKTLAHLLFVFALIVAFSNYASAQEVKKDSKSEVKTGGTQQTAKTNGKTETKKAQAGEPVPGAEITLEQEPTEKSSNATNKDDKDKKNATPTKEVDTEDDKE